MNVDIARIQLLVRALEQRADSSSVVDLVLKESGLSRERIAPPAKVYDAINEAQFVRFASDALQDITFGAQAGLQFTASSSLPAYIGKYSKDLRQVLENASKFHDIIDPAISFSLRVSSNFAAVEAEWKNPGFARYHRRTEFLLFGALARMRAITDVNFFPIELRFQHEVGKHVDSFQKIGGFPVVFGAEKLEIILPLSSLDLPIPTYDPRLREHLLEYGERLLTEHRATEQMLRAKVEGLITRSMPGNMIRAEEAAANLGLSPRTFARRLKDEGISYREIVDDLRCDLAQTFIKNGMNLSEISFSLGYADQAAFSTAFKRWTGRAPGDFRKRFQH